MTPRFDVTGFGEIMVRLSVPAGSRLETAANLDVHLGGAEGNVLCALSALGRRTAWSGGLPENALGHLTRNHLRRSGVSTETVIWKPNERMGLFFIEFSGAPRMTQVHYDRAGSAAARVTKEEIPWDLLLDTRLIHLSGITPALSASCRAATEEIVARARKKNVAVSFDINYRSKLWTEAEASAVLTPLIQGVDLLLCGRADAEALFGCTGDPETCARSLMHLSHAKSVVVSLGDQGAVAWDRNTALRVEQGPVQIVDRIGAGDAMAAGVIHGWLDGDLKKGLDYGMVLAAMALSADGDTVMTSEAEVAGILKESRRSVNR